MNQQIINIIVAMAQNRAIGIDNALPWHIPEDLKYFKAATTGKPIIMGRKTWESLGRPLPNRRNILITRNSDYQAEGAEVFHDLMSALAACSQDAEVCIIGGANLYKQAISIANKMTITEINLDVEADAFFPEFCKTEWQEISRAPQVSEKGIHYAIVHYQKV